MAVRDSRQSMPKQPSSFAHTEREREETDRQQQQQPSCVYTMGSPRLPAAISRFLPSHSVTERFAGFCVCVSVCVWL
jgi:hypothetical protein